MTMNPSLTFRFAGVSYLTLLLSCPALAASDEAARIRLFETSLRAAVSVQGAAEPRWTVSERMAYWKVPGLSLAVIRNGQLAWAQGYGVLQAGKPEKVDTQSLFSVGSVSKVGAAAVTLRLVDAGQLNLDRNVNGYLRRWQVPDTAYTAIRPVTLRGLLSHSAGLTVHGFPDFQPGAPLPTVIDTLEGRAPAVTDPVRVRLVPGAQYQYSGGGITVEQLVIEEVTGLAFPQAAQRYLFAPLGMRRSTYENPVPAALGNIAKAHGDDGQPRALPRGYEAMPEMAASGLWTTPSDYARLVMAFIRSYHGAPGSFLSTTLAHQMMTEVGRSPVGLGPFLEGEGRTRRFSHGGANDSYKAWMEGHLGTGNGVVIFTNGSQGASLYAEVRRAVAVAEGWESALSDHVQVPAMTLSARELEEKTGVYEVQDAADVVHFRHRSHAFAYRVSDQDGALYLSALGDDEDVGQRLMPTDAVRFITDRGTTRVEFVRDYAGQVSRLIVRLADGVIEAQKVMAQAAAESGTVR